MEYPLKVLQVFRSRRIIQKIKIIELIYFLRMCIYNNTGGAIMHHPFLFNWKVILKIKTIS